MNKLINIVAMATLTFLFSSHSVYADEHSGLPQAALDEPLGENGYLTREIANGVFMVTDSIYQAMFVPTGEGVVVFDAPYSLGEKIKKAIAEQTSEPITHLVYSHSHVDHIGASAVFGENVIRVASRHTANKLAIAEDKRRLPVTQAFDQSMTLTVGDFSVKLSDAGKGHNDGNLYIYLPKQKVLMNVDVIYPGWVPFTNLGMAEDIQGYIDQHEAILDFDFNVFIGGHLGRPGNRQDVEIAKEYILDLITFAQKGHQQANFYATAKQVGWENKWLLVKTYMDDISNYCTTEMLKRWSKRLGGAEVSTAGHCFIMQEHIAINGLPAHTLSQLTKEQIK